MKEKQLRASLRKLSVQVDHQDADWLICYCPYAPWYHKSGRDSTPSFGVHIDDTDRSGFHCWACKSKGSIPKLAFDMARLREQPELVALGKKIEFDEILGADELDFGEWGAKVNAKTVDREKEVKPFPDTKAAFAKYRPAVSSAVAVRYLNKRGISLATASSARLRVDDYQQRILFPVWDHWTGHFAGFSGRSWLSDGERDNLSAELSRREHRRIKVPKVRDYYGLPKRNLLLGEYRPPARYHSTRRFIEYASDRPYIILVEGLFAYLRLTQLGYGHSVRALLGSELTPEKIEILRDIGKAIYWFTDDDDAGHICMYGREGLRGGLDTLYGEMAQFVPSWPDGKDDPDQLTGDEVESMIAGAELYVRPKSLTGAAKPGTFR